MNSSSGWNQTLKTEPAPEISKTRGGGKIVLRPATLDDAGVMFSWQCAPEVRRFSRNQEPPTWEIHCGWLRSAIDDEGCRLSVILEDDVPVGVLRLDRLPERSRAKRVACLEVSILVAPSHHRRGIATAALRAARTANPGAMLYAMILPDNTASAALFRQCGYSKVGKWFVNCSE